MEHATGCNHSAPPPSRGLQSTLSNEEEAQEGDDDLIAINGYLNGLTDASANALAGCAAANISASLSHKHHDAMQNRYICIVHINKVHHLILVTCSCQGDESIYVDLMYAWLVSATFVWCQTLFTTAVLDDFHLKNLECKVSTYQYFVKLSHLTNPWMPTQTPNLYQELIHMKHVWQWLKKKKWTGHAHCGGDIYEMAPGELANFCVACPQPGINVAATWKNDPNG